MKVFKFGGASVRDAESIRNVKKVLDLFKEDKIVVVISAMDKTTNALEEVVSAYFRNRESAFIELQKVKDFHQHIINNLFPETNVELEDEISNIFLEIEWTLEEDAERDYGFIYDQIVSQGEFLSTRIISSWLNSQDVKNVWADIRDYIRTDNTYREGQVDWASTGELITKGMFELMRLNQRIITQGFVGGTSENYNTTLGREGSDYTAAIIAHVMDAEEVCIWKDVPGVLNADPKYFNDAVLFDKLSYHESIELAYYGASVIHPKTLKPLENKNIPLYVRSFKNPENPGTVITETDQLQVEIPSYIFKSNQTLFSISANDFSFVVEDHLSRIFSIFARHHVRINLMQNSALSFSACVDHDAFRIPPLITNLQKDFKVLYNTDLELYTVRHYNQEIIDKLSEGREIILEQRSRSTAQLLFKSLPEV